MVRRIWEDVGNMIEMLSKFFFNKKRHWIWRLSSTHGNQSYLLQPIIPSTVSPISFSQSYQHNKASGKPERQGSSELSGWWSPLTHQRNAPSGHGIMFGTMDTLFFSVSLHSAGPDSWVTECFLEFCELFSWIRSEGGTRTTHSLVTCGKRKWLGTLQHLELVYTVGESFVFVSTQSLYSRFC